jgi:hypothetical protein
MTTPSCGELVSRRFGKPYESSNISPGDEDNRCRNIETGTKKETLNSTVKVPGLMV